MLYGPFKKNNRFTTESNAAFDESLRRRNPTWGYRDIGTLEQVAQLTRTLTLTLTLTLTPNPNPNPNPP